MGKIGHAIGYAGWIIKEIFAAGIDATVAAFKRDPGLEPVIIFYPLRVESDWDIFWFSTSITVTPGTLSLGLRHRSRPDGPEVLIVQAAFGSDPEDIIAGLADMEEHVNPAVKATPLDPSQVLWEPYQVLEAEAAAGEIPPAERME